MIARSFEAPDFTGFWRHWNPFLGYFLAYFCFAPLRRFAPRSPCLIATFGLNGVIHDLMLVFPWGVGRTECLPFPFPVFTLTLVLIAVIILAAERLQLTMVDLSLPKRAACHLLALIGPFTLAIFIFLLTRK